MNPVFQEAQALTPRLVPILQTLHRHPELSFQEHETTRFLKDRLRALGLQLIDLGMETGVVALLEGSRPGKLIAVRADIDAIPLHEPEDHAIRSAVDGVMHACGHDFHMTCSLGAAILLAKRRNRLQGDVVLVFQPAEEVTRGAAKMLEQGLLDKLPGPVAAIFGLHAEPRLATGQVISSPDFASAAKINYRIMLRGTRGHGGSPHTYRDVIPAGAAIVHALQTLVSRKTDPQQELVCAVHTIKAGEAEFFVTDTLSMSGTIRAFDQAVSRSALDQLTAIATRTAAAYGCDCNCEVVREVPAQMNHPSLRPVAEEACRRVFGEGNTLIRRPLFMGSEDFSEFGKVIPSHFYWLGTGFPDRENAFHHEPEFRVDDQAIPYGVSLLVESVLGTAGGAGIS